jgi:hypothetical protein
MKKEQQYLELPGTSLISINPPHFTPQPQTTTSNVPLSVILTDYTPLSHVFHLTLR